MPRRYETIFITPADIPDEELHTLIERYSAIITGRKGILVKVEKWGKRKLAYEIKKHLRGYYILLDFAGQTDVVNELERNFKIDDKILKYMTIKKEDAVDLKVLEAEINLPAKETKPEEAIVPSAGPEKAEEEKDSVAPADAETSG
ncbi:MAG TPA: 30S ribosomal protein S6 [Syntrophus sp. (in: bacteria)]|jgi:small subunit ribosomal protein S6|nr:30S ribosomal protein S6 [Syntrophus sp. (in: bacteria)]